MNWKLITLSSLPGIPENVPFLTKIDDENGVRNEQKLIRRGNLWWYPDGSMYVYYTPTHYLA